MELERLARNRNDLRENDPPWAARAEETCGVARHVVVGAPAWHELRTTAVATAPAEACGVLGGARRGDAVVVTAFVPVANAAAQRDRFAMQPADFAAVLARLERDGSTFVGFAHTHPGGAARPSATDRRELWPCCVHLIAAPAPDGGCDIAAFWLQDGAFARLPLALHDGGRADCAT